MDITKNIIKIMNFYIKKNSRNLENEKKKIIDKIIDHFRKFKTEYHQKEPNNLKNYDVYKFNKSRFLLEKLD